jgi:hypothetical protein
MSAVEMAAVSRTGIGPKGATVDSNLARRVDLIEDRPEDVFTWSDLVMVLGAMARRINEALRRLQRRPL